LTYAELVQFHAYCGYIRKNQDNLRLDSFWDWMRVIKNLTENTNYDGLDDFKRSIRSVNDLLNASQRILAELSDPKVKVHGFDEQQLREERLKAQLIERSGEWRSQILEAEKHGYFKGQIEFLFAFSGVLNRWLETGASTWAEHEDDNYRKKFKEYFAKASAVFSVKGLNDFGECRWERSLLSIGDYLLPQGKSGNFSFLINSDRYVSWKRLLQGGINPNDSVEKRRGYVKTLLDLIELNIGVAKSLDSVIERATPTDEWRRVFVEKRELVAFCWKRIIRFLTENRVYLLRGVRMSSEHAELFSYYLKVGLLSDKHINGTLTPFAEPAYSMMKTDSEEPFASLEYKYDGGIIVLYVLNKNGAYELRLSNRDKALPATLKDALKGKALFADDEGQTISRTVDRLQIDAAIDKVVSAVRELAKTPTP
jgi:hypothetical protein